MSPLGFFRHIPTNLQVNPPTITVNTVSDQLVESGGNTTFSVTASFTAGASGTLFYQWYEVNSIGVETLLPGEDSTTLALTNQVDPANANRRFRCYVAFTRSGSTAPAVVSPVKSNIASLTIRPFITINTSFPTSQAIVAGNNVTFTASATVSSGGSGSLRYQWYRDGVLIPGATSDSYTIFTVPESLNGSSYYCIVSQAVSPAKPVVADPKTTPTATLTVSPAIATVRLFRPLSSNKQKVDTSNSEIFDLAKPGVAIPLIAGNVGGRWEFEAVDRDIYLNIYMKGTAGRVGSLIGSRTPGRGGEGQIEIFAKKGQRFTFKLGGGSWTERGSIGGVAPGCPGGGRGDADPVPVDIRCYTWNEQAPFPQYRASDGGFLYAGGKKELATGGSKSNFVGQWFSVNFDGGSRVVSSPQICRIKYRIKHQAFPRFDKRTSAQKVANEQSPGFDATFERRIYGTAIGEVRDLWERKTVGWPSYNPSLPESQRPRRDFTFEGDHEWKPEWGTPRIEIWYIGNTIGDVGFSADQIGNNNVISPTADRTPDNYVEYSSSITTYSDVDGTDGGGGSFLYEGGSLLACVGGGGGCGVQGDGGDGGGFNQNGRDGGGPRSGKAATAAGLPGKGGNSGLAYNPYGNDSAARSADLFRIGPFDRAGNSFYGAKGGSGIGPIRCSTSDAALYCNMCNCLSFEGGESVAIFAEGRNNGGFGDDGSGGGGGGFAGGGGGDDGSGGGGGSGFARPGVKVLSASTGSSSADFGEAEITLSSRFVIPVNVPVVNFVNNLPSTFSTTAGNIERYVINVQDTANFDPATTSFQYQWFLGGVQYSAATSNTLRLRMFRSDGGKVLQCKVIARNAAGTTTVLSAECKLSVARSASFTRTTPSLPTSPNFTFGTDDGGRNGVVPSTNGPDWDDTATHRIVTSLSIGKGRLRFSTRPNGLIPNIFGRKSNAPRGTNCGGTLANGTGISYDFEVRIAIIQNGARIWSSHDRYFDLGPSLSDASNFSSSDSDTWDFDEIQDLDPNYPAQLVFQFKKSAYDQWECSPANVANFINQTSTSNYAEIAFKFGDFYIASTDAIYDYESGGAGDFTLGARDNIDPNS
jgi:hypothetical protein